jgi:hypothetical protein
MAVIVGGECCITLWGIGAQKKTFKSDSE